MPGPLRQASTRVTLSVPTAAPGTNLASTSLVGEGLWLAAGQAASAIAGVVGTRLLTEWVPPSVYGVVNLLLGLALLGRSILCAPVLQALLRFYPDMARDGNVDGLRRTVQHLLSRPTSLLTGLTLVVGWFYSRGGDVGFGAFVALAVIMTVDVARTLETNLLTAARRQALFSLWVATESWAKPLFAVAALLLLGVSPQTVLLGYLSAAGLTLLVFRTFAGEIEGIHGETQVASDAALAAAIRRYALPLAPMAVVGWISSLSDRYIVAAVLGTREAGIYAAVYGLMSTPFLMAQGVIGQTLRPVYFGVVSRGDASEERHLLRLWLTLTAAVCASGALAVFLLQEWIARLLLGVEYREGVSLMPWIAGGNAILSVGYVFESRLYAQKRTNALLLGQGIGAIAALLFTVPLVYRCGLMGAAVACPIYFSVFTIALFLLSR